LGKDLNEKALLKRLEVIEDLSVQKIDTANTLLDEFAQKIDTSNNSDLAYRFHLIRTHAIIKLGQQKEGTQKLRNIEQQFRDNKNVQLQDWFNYINTIRTSVDLEEIRNFSLGTDSVKAPYIHLLSRLRECHVLQENGYTNKAETILKYLLKKNQIEGSKAYLAEVHNRYSRFLMTASRFEESLFHMRASHEFHKELDNKYGMAATLNSTAVVYRQQGLTNQALKYFHESLEISSKIKSKKLTSFTKNNIGIIYDNKGDYQKALEMFMGAKAVFAELGEPRPLSYVNTNIGVTLSKMGNYDEAKKYYDESIAQKKKLKDTNGLIYSHITMGDLFRKKKKYKLAKEQYVESKRLALQIQSKRYSAIASLGLAQLASNDNNYMEVQRHAKEGNSIAFELKNYQVQQECLELLALAYEKQNQFQESLDYLKAARVAQDSASSKRKIKEVEQLTFEYEQKNIALAQELEMEKIKTDSVRKDAIIRTGRQRRAIYLMLLLAALTSLFFGYRNMLQKRKANLALEKINVELEDKNETLRINQEKLEDTNTNLLNFSGMAAHDLKSPLKTMASFTGLLKRKYQDKIEEADQTYFDIVAQSGVKLSKMIDELLKFSRIDQKLPSPQLIDTNKLIHSITDLLKSTIVENRAKIEFTDLHAVHGHEGMIQVLFQNIIQNSLKFQQSNSPSVIRLRSTDLSNGKVRFSISDNGIGIAEDDLQDVFKGFNRLHSNSEYEGTGIGLATCKKICQYYGCSIWIESELGKGTTTYFDLLKKVGSD